MTKYNRYYKQIVENAAGRVKQRGYETHHITPRSLGGDDSTSNLVNLTPREHFICHWLLTKITAGEDRYKMLNALRMMRAENPNQERYDTKITARVYERIKLEYAELQSQRMLGENNPMYGVHWTDEQKKEHSSKITGRKQTQKEKEKQIAAQTGRPREQFSQEWLDNMSKAKQGENNPMYGRTHSNETKAKQSAKATGRKQSEETVKKKADAIRGSKREKKLCVYCNQHIAVNGYARFHGDNCKYKT